MKRRSLRFAADGQFYLVIPRQRKRALRPCRKIKRAWDLSRILVAQIPREPIHPFICRNRFHALDAIGPLGRLLAFFFLFAGKMPDHFARTIEVIERDLFFWRGLEIIINDCSRRRVITDWLSFVEFLR